MQSHKYTILARNIASGNATVDLPYQEVPLKDYALIHMIATHWGLDQADATVILQGSLDRLSWYSIGTITPAAATPIATAAFPGGNIISLAGDRTALFVNGLYLYVAGSTTNDGRKLILQTNHKGRLTYSGASGALTVGSTITGSVSGATAIIAAKTATLVYLKDLVGDFDAADVITETGAGSQTANVDTVDDFTTILVEETLTTEVAAGNTWVAQTTDKTIAPEDTCWLYYRVAIAIGTCTKGFVEATVIGKAY